MTVWYAPDLDDFERAMLEHYCGLDWGGEWSAGAKREWERVQGKRVREETRKEREDKTCLLIRLD